MRLAARSARRLAHQTAEVEVAPALVLPEPHGHPLEVASQPALERVRCVPSDFAGPHVPQPPQRAFTSIGPPSSSKRSIQLTALEWHTGQVLRRIARLSPSVRGAATRPAGVRRTGAHPSAPRGRTLPRSAGIL